MNFILLIIAIGLIILGPFLTIASLNTLFNLDIAYALETWASVVWLTMVTFGNVVTTIKNKK